MNVFVIHSGADVNEVSEKISALKKVPILFIVVYACIFLGSIALVL